MAACEMYVAPPQIGALLQAGAQTQSDYRTILAKALQAQGLTAVEVAALLTVTDPQAWQEIFAAAPLR